MAKNSVNISHRVDPNWPCNFQVIAKLFLKKHRFQDASYCLQQWILCMFMLRQLSQSTSSGRTWKDQFQQKIPPMRQVLPGYFFTFLLLKPQNLLKSQIVKIFLVGSHFPVFINPFTQHIPSTSVPRLPGTLRRCLRHSAAAAPAAPPPPPWPGPRRGGASAAPRPRRQPPATPKQSSAERVGEHWQNICEHMWKKLK